MNELATQGNAALLEQVLVSGDLSKLSPEQRVMYYKSVCESVGLNPLTKPFDYITLNSKLVLYAKKDATDQLRHRDQVSITKMESRVVNDVYVVTAYATNEKGRSDASTGAVSIGNLHGDQLANAMMKAETKAKRRVTLSICGLGLLDETEVETIQDAKETVVDQQTGEITEVVETPVDKTNNQERNKALYEFKKAATAKGLDSQQSNEILAKCGNDPFAALEKVKEL